MGPSLAPLPSPERVGGGTGHTSLPASCGKCAGTPRVEKGLMYDATTNVGEGLMYDATTIRGEITG